jgi:hypothetical protein
LNVETKTCIKLKTDIQLNLNGGDGKRTMQNLPKYNGEQQNNHLLGGDQRRMLNENPSAHLKRLLG